MLGAWTNEIPLGCHMTGAWVAPAPKCYGYTIRDPLKPDCPKRNKEKVKTKGIPARSVMADTKRKVQKQDLFDIMIGMTSDDSDKAQKRVEFMQFQKNHSREMTSVDVGKMLRLMTDSGTILFDKRQLYVERDSETGEVITVDTAPWGYCRSRQSMT
jgi:hypothetical protein